MKNHTPKIVVVGSSNMDLISYVPSLPKEGETLFGTKFVTGFGGKGANQAIIASLLGAKVSMICKLGLDDFGKGMKKNFEDHNIDTRYVYTTEKCSSGVAPILVSETGSNCIVVVKGANDLLKPEEIEQSENAFIDAKVLLTVLEIPVQTVVKALQLAKKHGVITIVNPAPAQKDFPNELFSNADFLCPNESELEILSGITIKNPDDLHRAVDAVLEKGVKQVIVTMGEKGSLYCTKNDKHLVPAVSVKALDTSGAGDCYIGSIGFFLGSGLDIEESLKRASKVASISVQREGTQTSYPNKKELSPEWWS